MEREQTRDLLEQMHQFPCAFTIKAIGKVENGFVHRLVAAVREELAATIDPPYRLRETANGRHVAVTLEPTIQNAEQVLAVYKRISQVAGLEYLL